MKELTKRQNEIVATSIKLISEGGIQNLTMKTLAANLGVTEPAIYRHFSSKMDILFAMLDLVANSNKKFKQEIEEKEPSMSLLEHMFVNNSEMFIKNPELSSIIFSEEIFQNNEILADKVLKIMEERNRLTCKVIEDVQKTGEIRSDIPPQKLTLIIIGTLRLTISTWKLSGFSYDLDSELSQNWAAISCLFKK